MHRQHVQRFGWHLGAALLIALADIWLKTEVMSFLFSRETSFYPLFNGFNLNVVWNTGVSFGLFRLVPPCCFADDHRGFCRWFGGLAV